MTVSARPGDGAAPSRNRAGDIPPDLDATSLTSLLDRLGDVAWYLDGNGECTWAGQRWELATGMPVAASRGLGWLDAVQTEDRPPLLSALATGSTPGPQAVDLRLRHAPDGKQRWHRARLTRLRDRQGADALFLCLAADIDDLRRPHETQVQAIAALQHRMRGTFGTIRAIIRRTARFSGSAEAFADSLEGRVAALARAQASVIRAPTAGVDLAQLVADELAACAAHEGASVGIDGPSLRLAPRAAETLAQALHELASNAVEHGALGARQARVDVSWAVTADGMLEFERHETGTALPAADTGHHGYGQELLEGLLAYELKAETRLRFGPGGLRLDLRMPVAGNVLGQDATVVHGSPGPAGSG